MDTNDGTPHWGNTGWGNPMDQNNPTWSSHHHDHGDTSGADPWPSSATIASDEWPTSSGAPISRWTQNTDQNSNAEFLEDSMEASSDQVEEASEDSSRYFAVQLSPSDYQRQTNEYTKAAVDALVRSPEYQRIHTRCRLCWSVWSEGMFSGLESCAECGGFALQRPCPICEGRCGNIWTRDVESSHDTNQAHWDGECGLPDEQRQAYMIRYFTECASENEVVEGIGALTTKPQS